MNDIRSNRVSVINVQPKQSFAPKSVFLDDKPTLKKRYSNPYSNQTLHGLPNLKVTDEQDVEAETKLCKKNKENVSQSSAVEGIKRIHKFGQNATIYFENKKFEMYSNSQLQLVPATSSTGRNQYGMRKSIFLGERQTLSKRLSVTYNEKFLTTIKTYKNTFEIDVKAEDIVFKSSKPVYIFLRTMGVFPFTRTSPGEAEFKWISSAMGYSVFVFLLLVAYVIYVAIKRIQIVQTLEGRFEESVIAYLFLVNILPIFIVPMIWSETTKVTRVLNDWTDFEIMYYSVCRKTLPLDLKRKALLISILLPLLSSLSVIVTHATLAEFSIIQVIPYCLLDNLTYMMGAYWYLACETLSTTATILAEDFQKALKNIGPAAMVADYRALWLRLSKLTRDTGTATCTTFIFLNLYLFSIITLSIYGLMSKLSEGFGTKDIGLAVTAACNICLLFFICDEAHYASHYVKTNFQKKMLMVELSWMNSDAQTEIGMFLRATEMNPSNINCGGFFDVNRNLFKSLLTTMVTYLVVLLQFQISIPDDSLDLYNNSTLNM